MKRIRKNPLFDPLTLALSRRERGLIGVAQRAEGLIGAAQRAEGLIGAAQRAEGLVGVAQLVGGLIGVIPRESGLIGVAWRERGFAHTADNTPSRSAAAALPPLPSGEGWGEGKSKQGIFQ